MKTDDETFNERIDLIDLFYLFFIPQNGFIECEKNSCPAVDDCYTLVKKSSGTCCDKCRECYYKGETYPSGHEWTDPEDPCLNYKCIAGVVTESVVQCYAPCSNPLPPRPNECCSSCLGKFHIFYFFIPFPITHAIDDLSRLEKNFNRSFIIHYLIVYWYLLLIRASELCVFLVELKISVNWSEKIM